MLHTPTHVTHTLHALTHTHTHTSNTSHITPHITLTHITHTHHTHITPTTHHTHTSHTHHTHHTSHTTHYTTHYATHTSQISLTHTPHMHLTYTHAQTNTHTHTHTHTQIIQLSLEEIQNAVNQFVQCASERAEQTPLDLPLPRSGASHSPSKTNCTLLFAIVDTWLVEPPFMDTNGLTFSSTSYLGVGYCYKKVKNLQN